MNGIQETSKMKGKVFIDKTIQQQKERYEKKFAFEKGQYHQCIPNPHNPDQRITVQIVERVLEESFKSGSNNSVADCFSENANSKAAKAANISKSQVYERYNLITPESAAEQAGAGEGEGEN